MAAVVADGTIVAYASTYGSAKTMSAVTNANPAVATLEASHGVIVNDIMEMSSGWPELDDKILRASVVSTNDVTLEGFTTANTTKFPAGSGTGTVREITAWTNLSQILSIAVEGGDPQYLDYQFLNELQKRRIPLAKAPLNLTLELADDITLAQQAAILAIEQAAVPVAMKLTLPNSSKVYMNGYWTITNLPKIQTGQINTRTIGFALTSLPTEYSS
jgi:Phage tail tube protein, TTP